MTTEQFIYWLQGFVELHGAPPSASQWEVIKEHLQLVFDKKTVKTVEKKDSDKSVSDFLKGLADRNKQNPPIFTPTPGHGWPVGEPKIIC